MFWERIGVVDFWKFVILFRHAFEVFENFCSAEREIWRYLLISIAPSAFGCIGIFMRCEVGVRFPQALRKREGVFYWAKICVGISQRFNEFSLIAYEECQDYVKSNGEPRQYFHVQYSFLPNVGISFPSSLSSISASARIPRCYGWYNLFQLSSKSRRYERNCINEFLKEDWIPAWLVKMGRRSFWILAKSRERNIAIYFKIILVSSKKGGPYTQDLVIPVPWNANAENVIHFRFVHHISVQMFRINATKLPTIACKEIYHFWKLVWRNYEMFEFHSEDSRAVNIYEWTW